MGFLDLEDPWPTWAIPTAAWRTGRDDLPDVSIVLKSNYLERPMMVAELLPRRSWGWKVALQNCWRKVCNSFVRLVQRGPPSLPTFSNTSLLLMPNSWKKSPPSLSQQLPCPPPDWIWLIESTTVFLAEAASLFLFVCCLLACFLIFCQCQVF